VGKGIPLPCSIVHLKTNVWRPRLTGFQKKVALQMVRFSLANQVTIFIPLLKTKIIIIKDILQLGV
jgi:hypothetical protein